MSRRHTAFALVIALFLGAGQLAAHHSWPVSTGTLVTVKGTVTEFTWANPHPMMSLDIRTEGGQIEKWTAGGPAINRMEANGWSRTTLKPGDVITASGYQFSDGQKIIRLEKVVFADGREMLLYGRR